MRSCASLPFIVILLGITLWALAGHFSYLLFSKFCMFWSLAAVTVQPYKEKYMATSDAFTLSITSISSIVIYNQTKSPSGYDQIALQILGTLPMSWLVGFIILKVFKTKLKTLLNLTREKLSCCHLLNCGNTNEEGNEAQCAQQVGNFNYASSEADCMLCPEEYMWPQGYGSIS